MHFRYKAIDALGIITRGEEQADDIADLQVRLQRRALQLLSARRSRRRPQGSLQRRELAALAMHLEQLLDGGLPLIAALADLRDSAETPALGEFAEHLRQTVESGQSFSQALRAVDPAIDPIFLALVAAGEDSGQLPEILRRLALSLQQAEEFSERTGRLLLYPALAGSMVLSAALFLLLYLVPQIRLFLNDNALALPLATRLLFALTDFLAAYWPPLLTIPATVGIGAIIVVRTRPAWRRRYHRLRLSLPLFGKIERKLAIVRLADLLALFYRSGIPLLTALQALPAAAGNSVIASALGDIARSVTQGECLSAAFARHPLFPPAFIGMLRLGETSGELDKALQHVARRYEREAVAALTRLQTLIEPALTLCIGGLLGWIMLATLQPIYGIISQAAP